MKTIAPVVPGHKSQITFGIILTTDFTDCTDTLRHKYSDKFGLYGWEHSLTLAPYDGERYFYAAVYVQQRSSASVSVAHPCYPDKSQLII